jgi:hypothetical protein
MTHSQASTIPAPRQAIPPTVAERFVDFHTKSPDVYHALVTLARQWVARTGRRKLGIKTLFERARWELALTTSDPDFKLNNNYAPYYARVIMRQESDLDGMFDLRTSEADDWLLNEPVCTRCQHLWLSHRELHWPHGITHECRHCRCWIDHRPPAQAPPAADDWPFGGIS